MFIIQYFTSPKQTGALCASSSKLAAAMTENIDFQKARNIAEIGAGTGAFTRHILSKKDEDANFFAVEINEKMANKLSHKFENLDEDILPLLPTFYQHEQGLDLEKSFLLYLAK